MTNGEKLEDTVQFSIGLDTVISTEVEFDREGEMTGNSPVTLGMMVAQLVAYNVTQQLSAEVRREYMKPVRDRLNEIADKLVEEKMREVLDREIVPTDPYSNAKAETTTLAELIATRANTWLTTKSGDRYNNRTNSTNLDKMIDAAVGQEFQTAISTAAKQAQDAAVKAVADKAGAAMAEILRKAAQ